MKATPTTGDYTIEEAAQLLEVTRPWLFAWLKDNNHMTKNRVPKGIAAANGYMRLAYGSHVRPGLGKCTHHRPVITQTGLNWLTQEVAKAKLEETQTEKQAG